MPNVNKQLAAINAPDFKERAMLASSPYVLSKIFAADPAIRRLLEAGDESLPAIAKAVAQQDGADDEITMAAYAYIVANVKPQAAPEILGPAYERALAEPGPFFVHFAAHAIRAGTNMPIKPLEIAYFARRACRNAELAALKEEFMPPVTGIKTAADVELTQVLDRGGTVTHESDSSLIPLVQYYRHFDLSNEELGRTTRYNCWAFTFLPRRYWINSSADVDQILHDNCIPVAPGSVRPGDVIRYRDAANVTTHTGRVWAVDGAGNCTLVRSKWGAMAEYVHIPLHPFITPSYGTNLAFFRQIAPLKGLGDLWIRDSSTDNGEQANHSLWASPDILMDAPPYGSVDANAVFGEVNRVWTFVHNRSNRDIANVRVRYYWADPHAGFAPSNWQLIPPTAGHPNPTNAFTAPANSSVQAPYVEWVPVPVPDVSDPAHQCLLAVTFINDDPKDSNNPRSTCVPVRHRLREQHRRSQRARYYPAQGRQGQARSARGSAV